MASHENFRALDDLRSLMGYNVTAEDRRPRADREADQQALQRRRREHRRHPRRAGQRRLAEGPARAAASRSTSTALKEAADSNPVRKLINLVLLQAIKDKASDIHFEPFEDEFKMRYRIDGVLYEMMPPPRAPRAGHQLAHQGHGEPRHRRAPPAAGRPHRAERRQPADRPARQRAADDVRRERRHARARPHQRQPRPRQARHARGRPGRRSASSSTSPTASCSSPARPARGKTTTLYSALSELNDITDKIITTEDPVEYDIDGIIQCQINADIELTFAAHPARDPASGPGHRSWSARSATWRRRRSPCRRRSPATWCSARCTPTTPRAPIARLLDLGLEPFLVTATLEGIVAQRLVRKICVNCKDRVRARPKSSSWSWSCGPRTCAGQKFFYGKGCEHCNNTGYRGRMGIFEIMLLDDEMRDMIIKHASTQVLRAEAKQARHADAAPERAAGDLRRRDDDRRSRPRDDHGRRIDDCANFECRRKPGGRTRHARSFARDAWRRISRRGVS